MAAADVQEIQCKSLLNRVDIPNFPFRWTINPYRGCRHACTYCYARPTHEFWGMDSGREFEQRVFAKVNAPAVLRQELSRPRWQGEAIALGTASDPYEPAEAQYGLTRRILEVLAEFRNPASITTKGVLVRRDVDVLQQLHQAAEVQVVFSVGTLDEKVWKQTEPGTPSPQARLEAMQYLVESGIPAGVMMAPLLPGLSDGWESIHTVVAAAAAHKAQFLSANLLFLKPGSKEWFMPLLRETYPHLAAAYSRLYHKTYPEQDYTQRVLRVVNEARRKWQLPFATPPRELKSAQGQLQLAFSA
ncbi:MAG: radical SAM protein [SAR202 cluster bacterium]|nr:radical SAM protein [SAR202 cluster bacterium]